MLFAAPLILALALPAPDRHAATLHAPRESFVREAQDPTPEERGQAFLDAKPEQRAALWAELKEELSSAEAGELLNELAVRTAKGLSKGSTLAQLERIAEQREELDTARETALGLIYDEQRYFYPYRVPDVSSQQAAQYPKVQAEVNELVDGVRDVWKKPKKVKLSKGFRASLGDWLLAVNELALLGRPLEVEEGGPGAIPEWVDTLSPEVESVTLHSFAWTAEERLALEESAQARVTNAETWKRVAKLRDFPEEQRASKAEALQVELTNDYREMMGRRALVWDPRLQLATHGHSEYMSRWGVLSHYEERDPEHYDLSKRTRLAGYDAASGENCSMGRSDPKSALEGWAGSSGHHRNMLAARHRAMASAESGGYWTQNYGTEVPAQDSE